MRRNMILNETLFHFLFFPFLVLRKGMKIIINVFLDQGCKFSENSKKSFRIFLWK